MAQTLKASRTRARGDRRKEEILATAVRLFGGRPAGDAALRAWAQRAIVAQPLDFAKELHGFDEKAIRRVMRDNCLELLGPEA